MASTTFTDSSTIIMASWLNEVNMLVHTICGNPTTRLELLATILPFIADNSSAVSMTVDTEGDIGIGGAPVATALLELTSTSKGFLPPRMTTTQRDAISSPATGLMIYNTSTNKLNFYNGTAWEAVTSA